MLQFEFLIWVLGSIRIPLSVRSGIMFASTKSKEVADEYISSLSDLTINSKPLINMLTMLAEDNIEHASAIVQAVETHLQKVTYPSIVIPKICFSGIDNFVR